MVDGITFERLLYVWEFFNNFNDFFEIPSFKIEELQAALTIGQEGQTLFPHDKKNDSDEEEQDWEEYITNKTLAEYGISLINTLHIAAVQSFFKDIRDSLEENKDKADAKDFTDHSNDVLLQAVLKYFDKGSSSEASHWPELIRIILKSKSFSFLPLSGLLETLCDEKLAGCLPETYPSRLTYDEKLTLLETLVDGLHTLEDFKSFLN